jgi:anti-sigma regulatory factor (Ser/Thr protein kinase)
MYMATEDHQPPAEPRSQPRALSGLSLHIAWPHVFHGSRAGNPDSRRQASRREETDALMTVATSQQEQAFVHEAFLYRDADEFLRGMLAFIRDGIDAGEPVFVVLSADKIGELRDALGEDADGVLLADMAHVGANPARIIAAWQEFVDDHGAGGQPIRGIGEPIWAGRSEPELAECHRHESLLNLAFADTPAFRLLCPYDVSALDPRVVEEAERTHPFVSDADSFRESRSYRGIEAISAPFADPLLDPPDSAEELHFDGDSLSDVRECVAGRAEDTGLSSARADNLVLAVNEIATNSIRHAGGSGVLRVWESGGFLLCQVEDAGRIDEPLVGRRQAVLDQPGGRGLWLANQLCDLVQVRTFEGGNVVRIHMACD